MTTQVFSSRRLLLGGGAFVLATLTCPLAQAAPPRAETVIYSFRGGLSGNKPQAGLVQDALGNLYGTTSQGGANRFGTVFELSPPQAGSTTWTHHTLYAFAGGEDGANPLGTLVLDKTGNLYGTTEAGGGAAGYGTVFELSPSAGAGKPWAETLLHTFNTPGDGTNPYAGLLLTASGELIGTAAGGGIWTDGTPAGGVVFKLTPPPAGQTAWSETILYNFNPDYYSGNGAAPETAVVEDGVGNLYGTTFGGYDYGVVYQLAKPSPGGSTWTYTELAIYSQSLGQGFASSLTLDGSGNVYGVSEEGGSTRRGVVFEFAAPVKPFTPTVLSPVCGGSFSTSGLVHGKQGGFFGTTSVSGLRGTEGSVFQVLPPLAGQTSWRCKSLYHFIGNPDGDTPVGNLIFDRGVPGTIYGVTADGGVGNHGTVYMVQ